jgi:hypothetical protein
VTLIDGNLHQSYFGEVAIDNKCSSVCLSKGMKNELLGFPIPDQLWSINIG